MSEGWAGPEKRLLVPWDHLYQIFFFCESIENALVSNSWFTRVNCTCFCNFQAIIIAKHDYFSFPLLIFSNVDSSILGMQALWAAREVARKQTACRNGRGVPKIDTADYWTGIFESPPWRMRSSESENPTLKTCNLAKVTSCKLSVCTLLHKLYDYIWMAPVFACFCDF